MRTLTSLQIALRPAGGRFGIVRTIEQTSGSSERVDLLPGDADQLTVGWIAGGAARVAETTGVRLGRVQTLAAGDVSDLNLADRAQGGLIASWLEPSFLRAAVRAPGADSFGDTETIAGPARIGRHLLAYDPATLLSVVAWTQGSRPNPPVYTATR